MSRHLEGYFRSFDKHEMFWQLWKEDGATATLVVTHGLGEHSESYHRLAEGVRGCGLDVAALDLRGHGRSWGRRGYVDRFGDYVQDLDYFVTDLKSQWPGRPLILLGHSLGGLVTIHYLLEHGAVDVKGLVLSSPLLGISVHIPALKKKAAELVAKYAPSFTLYNELPFRLVTRDDSVIDEYHRDPLRHDRVSAALYLGMLSGTRRAMEKAHELRIPTLIQQAGHDQVVSRSATERFFSALGSTDKKLIIYDKYRHEVYNDLGRERVFEDLRGWLKRWV